MERITYLVANYNCARFVGDCLRSLRAQTSPDWLALIADDASTDDSIAVITGLLDERCRVLSNKTNLGYVPTLQRLIAQATTDIVAILDADDALEPGATEVLLRAYAQHPKAEFVYSRFAAYDETLRVLLSEHGAPAPAGRALLPRSEVGHIRSFRRTAYARTDGLDPDMLYAEDRDLVYRLEEVTRPVFVDRVLYRYRTVPASQSRDPLKREIGARNTLRARRAALGRRRIRGVTRFALDALFWADYTRYSHTSGWLPRALASGVDRLATPAVRLLPLNVLGPVGAERATECRAD